jgi:4-diphosphocytidyl-2-C-methyl-D-erythritol kinase
MDMRVLARAKINWALDVVGKRPDGYHLLDMLLQSVAVCDTLTILKAPELTLRLSRGARVPDTDDNLVLKAARALKDAAGCDLGADIYLDKRIPIGAGMGGGSADAAAVIAGLNRLWELQLGPEELGKIGLKVGADVPFCLKGGLYRAQGVGEILTPHDCTRQFWLVVAQPCRGLGTKKVFTSLEWEAIPSESKPDVEAAVKALERGDLSALCHAMGNALQPTSATLRPEIPTAIKALSEHGAIRAMMTGSGSAVYGVFKDAMRAREAQQALKRRWPVCFMTHTCLEGLVFQEE